MGRKLAKAGRVASKRLKDSKTFMDSHRNDEFYASIAKALWGYISDILYAESACSPRLAACAAIAAKANIITNIVLIVFLRLQCF